MKNKKQLDGCWSGVLATKKLRKSRELRRCIETDICWNRYVVSLGSSETRVI